MKIISSNTGRIRLYLRAPLVTDSLATLPFPTPKPGNMSHQGWSGRKTRMRCGHTVEPAQHDMGPGYQFVAGQGHETVSSCYSDQYGFSKPLLPNRCLGDQFCPMRAWTCPRVDFSVSGQKRANPNTPYKNRTWIVLHKCFPCSSSDKQQTLSTRIRYCGDFSLKTINLYRK